MNLRALRRTAALAAGLTAALPLIAAPPAPAATRSFDPAYEARQYEKTQERANQDYTSAFDAQLATVGAQNELQGDQILATDGPAQPYGRNPTGNLCFHHQNGCAGDIRLYNWGQDGDGIVVPVLFTQRNGSTLSGHVWMTKAGPAKRPGIVFTNGSIQAPEPLYWYAAEALAKDGYIVLTFDPQGQGYSDTYGEGADRNDGVPSQSGGPFFTGTEDALDFFFSTPQHPYVPRKSCTSGTSHADKQAARVKAGLDSAYNPFYAHLDTAHVGLAGHSLGAAAVSYIGQLDPRVQAIVALDNLSDVTQPGVLTNFGQTLSCPSGSSHWPAPLHPTKPALGMSDDYGLTPMPFTSLPDPAGKLAASQSLSRAGVDSGELVIRGGTHYEFSYIPNQAFGATHRGMDFTTWYLLAWFDRYLKADPTATARLQTRRWCDDAPERAVDDQAPPDGDLFSVYLRSRLDIGGFDVEDLRAACDAHSPQLVSDPWPGSFSFLGYDLTKDSAATPGSTTAPGGAAGAPPAAARSTSCPHATGTLTGNRLGPLRLGMTRARARRALRRFSTRGHRNQDFFCLSPIGVRAVYRHGRVVLLLTANRHYALRGVRPGASLTQARHRLHLARGYHVGANYWFLSPGRAATGVLKSRRGRVLEVGLADPRATSGRARASRFLRTF